MNVLRIFYTPAIETAAVIFFFGKTLQKLLVSTLEMTNQVFPHFLLKNTDSQINRGNLNLGDEKKFCIIRKIWKGSLRKRMKHSECEQIKKLKKIVISTIY